MAISGPRTSEIGPRKIFVVAGEVSGDIQAAHLAAELLRRDPSIAIMGVGGTHMAAAGVSVLQDSSTWGVIGHVDPLLRVRAYLRRLREVEREIRRLRPDALMLVDFPAFNLRLAERLRGKVPVVYYFPPMVSVRRGNRAQRIARLGMRLLAAFQREAEAYRAAGADVVFIGHPALDLVRPHWDPQTARMHFGIPADARVVGLLPGSRLQEIHAHLPVMLRAAWLLRSTAPDLWFVLPLPAEGFRETVQRIVAHSGLPVRIVTEIYDAMAVAAVLVTAAGTATLEAAVLGVPLVTVYRLPWVSWIIARRIVSVRYASLPNILAGRKVVPELLQGRMTAPAIASEVRRFLEDPLRRNEMVAGLQQVAADLGQPGVVGRAADEVLKVLSRTTVAWANTSTVR